MTLVGEIDFQLLELNLADAIWMCYPGERFRILQHSSLAENIGRLTMPIANGLTQPSFNNLMTPRLHPISPSVRPICIGPTEQKHVDEVMRGV